jgi:predicted DNA-binding transcriptional regulator AlpA
MTQTEKLVTAKEVAEMLSLNLKTVYYLSNPDVGILPCVRIGGSVRFSLEEVWRAIHASGQSEPVASVASEARS